MSLSLDFTFERIPSLYSVVLFMMNHFLVYTDNQYLCVCSVICLHCMPVCDMLHGPGKRVLSVMVVCKLVLEIMQMCGLFVNLCLCDVQLSCVRGGASCKARG